MTRFGLVGDSPPPHPESDVQYLAWFRFPVTWTYLSGPPPAEVERVRPVPHVSTAAMTVVPPAWVPPAEAPNAIDSKVIADDSRRARSGAQWEMVIPKMVRPPAKPLADRILTAPASAPTSAAPTPPTTTARDHAPAEFTAPVFLAPDQSPIARFWRQIALTVSAIAAIGFLLWGHSGTGASPREQRAEFASRGGWSRRSISPPGRLMSVYEPSRDESDYRIEFAWVPDAKGVGWVFRTRAAGDYYGTRLTLLQPGARLVLAAEHFSVFGGVESAHSRKVIPLVNNSGLVRVRMDAIGPAFTLSLQDSPVDYWTDAHLDSGALGFYDERGQRPEVQALRFTFIKKGATRTAVASLP